MRPWDDPSIASLLENHQKHVRVFCDNKAALVDLAIAQANRPNLDLVFIDLSAKVSYLARMAQDEQVELSLLIGQDLCIAKARTVAKVFEAELTSLMNSWGAAIEYARYRPMTLSWAAQQLHQVSLMFETIEASNSLFGRGATPVVFMEKKWQTSIAQILGEKPVTLVSNSTSSQSIPPARGSDARDERLGPFERIIDNAWLWYTRRYAQSPAGVAKRLRRALGSPAVPAKVRLSSANVIAAFSARKRLHVDTIGPVVSCALRRGDRVRPLLINVDPVPSRAGSTEMQLDEVPFVETCTMRVFPHQQLAMSNAGKLAAKIILCRSQKEKELTAHGLPPSTVKTLLSRFFGDAFPTAVGVMHALRVHFAGYRNQILVTCTDSYWLTDVVRLAAENAGTPRLSIQNAYMSRSPRYEAPQGDIITVIDTWSQHLICEHFKCDPGAVWLIGTPRFDHIAKTFADGRATDKPLLDDILDVEQRSRKIVCFAAQDENLTVKTDRIIQRLAEVRSQSGPVTVIIKLHPSATTEFEDELKAIAARLLTPNAVIILKQYELQKLLLACDILITVSSNVGVEAAILEKDIVIANLERRQLSPPLDEFEIGVVAHTDREFVTAIERILDDPRARTELATQRQRYRRENAQLVAGASTELIADAIASHLSGEGGDHVRSKPLILGVT